MRTLTPILAAALTLILPAAAVASEGQDFDQQSLGEGTIAAPFDVTGAAGSQVSIYRHTLPAGAVSPWHSHPASGLGTVTSGTLTFYLPQADGTCQVETYGPGDGYVKDPDVVHQVRNEGGGAVEIIDAYFGLPSGVELTTMESAAAGRGCPGPVDGAPEIESVKLGVADVTDDFAFGADRPSDVAFSTVSIAAGVHTPWHRATGASAVAITSGVLELEVAGAEGCVLKRLRPGDGIVMTGQAHRAHNVGTAPVALVDVYAAVPSGQPLEQAASAPAGCSDAGEVATAGHHHHGDTAAQDRTLPQTGSDLPLVLALGAGLAGLGIVLWAIASRPVRS